VGHHHIFDVRVQVDACFLDLVIVHDLRLYHVFDWLSRREILSVIDLSDCFASKFGGFHVAEVGERVQLALNLGQVWLNILKLLDFVLQGIKDWNLLSNFIKFFLEVWRTIPSLDHALGLLSELLKFFSHLRKFDSELLFEVVGVGKVKLRF
jgi:hypothetical protein